MTLNIPFTEAASLINKRFGKIIEFNYINENTVSIGYEASIVGSFKKKFCINVTVNKVKNENVFLQCSAGRQLTDLLLNKAISALLRYFDTQVVTKGISNEFTVHLKEIEQAKTALEKIDVQSIRFSQYAILVNFCLKE